MRGRSVGLDPVHQHRAPGAHALGDQAVGGVPGRPVRAGRPRAGRPGRGRPRRPGRGSRPARRGRGCCGLPCTTASSRSTAAMSASSGTATSASSRAVRSRSRVVPIRAEASATRASRRRAASASTAARCCSVTSTTEPATPSTVPSASSSRYSEIDQACSSSGSAGVRPTVCWSTSGLPVPSTWRVGGLEGVRVEVRQHLADLASEVLLGRHAVDLLQRRIDGDVPQLGVKTASPIGDCATIRVDSATSRSSRRTVVWSAHSPSA